MATDTELFNEIKSFYVLPNIGASDHNCLCAAIRTKFWSPVEETKINVNKIDKISYTDPLNFMLKLEAPNVRQKLTAWTEESKHNQNLTANDLLESFSAIFKEVASENSSHPSVKAKDINKKKRIY